MSGEKQLLKKYDLGKLQAVYLQKGTQVELVLIVKELEKEFVLGKSKHADSLIQLKLEGDATGGGFGAGHTNHNSQSTQNLTYVDQMVETSSKQTTITTVLKNEAGLVAKHILEYVSGKQAVITYTVVENNGKDTLTLESLSSFSLSYLTPFAEDEATNYLRYHRIRSRWSAEGRVESGSIEDLQLEPSWSCHGVSVEKFGQIGSMPVRKFFPMIGIEDTKAGVVWASQLACNSSWQIEMYRRDEKLCICGGLADYDFGHWKKVIKPGETFTTPRAFTTVVKGDFDAACRNLVDMHEQAKPFCGDKKLPAVFNEYCTTWGKPSEKTIAEICQKIKGKGFDYFVIDAGWYANESLGWENNMGDWEVNRQLFPNGLSSATRIIREAGMKPGIWFELEVVGKEAKALQQTDHLLKKNGKVICSGDRYFWDMRDPWTNAYLEERVIGLLEKYGFEYIKIDYNETIGIGCDGSDSLGSGLYENILATQAFFAKIHERIPGIVIELCSSGGHRLEPSFLDATDMASFSDAHEEPEIPVIAANVHRVMRPEKSQIWSVIRENDTMERICYSVTNTFLGVLCISGDVLRLSDEKWKLIEDGMAFYRKLDAIQKDGETYYFGPKQPSYRKLSGWQGVLRKGTTTDEAYLILHSFEPGQTLQIPLNGSYDIIDVYEAVPHNGKISNGIFEVTFAHAYETMAVLLKSHC
ncbi:MAG: alpha-galactosidase [bacterium]|nr:alpha-galactosidase [bacterium]